VVEGGGAWREGMGAGRLEAGPTGRSVWGAAEPEGVGGEEEGAIGPRMPQGKQRKGGVWKRKGPVGSS
jgi:hypothetical protein